MTTRSSFIQAFGFSTPVSKGGRKTWPDGFRARILEKLDAGELTIQQVTKECGVSKSLELWPIRLIHTRRDECSSRIRSG